MSILTVSYCFHPLTIYAKAYWRIVIFIFTYIYIYCPTLLWKFKHDNIKFFNQICMTLSIDNFWNWIEQTHMVPVLWHRTNLDWKRHLFIVIQMESMHLFLLFSNKLHLLLNLQCCLKLSFFWGNKICIYLLIWWKSTIFFFWLPLSHAVFDGVFFLWIPFIKLYIYLFNE